MSIKAESASKWGFRSPPKQSVPKPTSPVTESAESVTEEAEHKEKRRLNLPLLGIQLGLAGQSFAGVFNSNSAAAAQVMPTDQFDASAEFQGIDLAIDGHDAVFTNDQGTEVHSIQLASYSRDTFERRDFNSEEAQKALENFDEEGRVYYERLGVFDKELSAGDAEKRLRDGKSVKVEVDGDTHKLKSYAELQELDTFEGLGLNPAASPAVIEALTSFSEGIDGDDGLVRDGAGLTSEQRVSAYDAYNMLTDPNDGTTGAGWKGAALGTLGAGLLVAAAGAGLYMTGTLPLLSTVGGLTAAGGVAVGAGAAGLVAGAALGAHVGYVSYKNDHPDELEVRHGIDQGLKIRTLDHATEVHRWLEDRKANPFTETQQNKVAEHFSQETGLYDGKKKLSAEDALKRLREGKSVDVPSSIPNHSDTIESLRELQQLDSIRGLKINPVLDNDISRALRFLESGKSAADGLYRAGQFESKGRLSAFQAANRLFWERDTIGVTVGGKNYNTDTLRQIQELNALQGDGINTILPEAQFQAIQLFDRNDLMTTGDQSLDSYQALQDLKGGGQVQVRSANRQATTRSLEDMHELKSLEFDQKNTILEQRDFDLLNHWQDKAEYRVDGDGQADRAYEALQSIQGRREFEIKSAGRWAPAKTFQDLEDLATFETPDAGFSNSIPEQQFDRLTYFQQTNEKSGGQTTRVGSREGRAYEGYRQLRDGNSFEVQAGGVWNTVTNDQALHDLDALLGRQVNDILPQKQYDLLKLLGDKKPQGEGFVTEGRGLNSYGVLQEFRQGKTVSYDFPGGDFGYTLSVPTENLEALEPTRVLRDNQKEYDRYRYTVGELRNKLDRQASSSPELARANLQHGQDELSAGQRKLSRGQSDLRNAESDLRRAEDDKRDGERDLRSAEDEKRRADSDLRQAQSLPSYKTERRRECDYSTNECEYVDVRVNNDERDRAESRARSDQRQAESKISRARSDIRDAESDIRRARSDISSAESLISSARRDIRTAEGMIADANRLFGVLDSYRDVLSGVNNQESYSQALSQLESKLAEMKSLSHISRLDNNLWRQQKLLANQQNRPARPAGWEVPSPLVQS